jgi:hypothetical protein
MPVIRVILHDGLLPFLPKMKKSLLPDFDQIETQRKIFEP